MQLTNSFRQASSSGREIQQGSPSSFESRRLVRASLLLAAAALTLSGCALSAIALPLLPVGLETAEAGAPTRAVRLSFVEGPVRVVEDGQVVADPAYANLSLFAGTQVLTGNDGRAEIQLEDGSIVRVSPNSMVTFPVLQKTGGSDKTEIVVSSGLAYLELQPTGPEHSIRVSYGQTSFSATSFSVVRINQDRPPGQLAVFSGNVHLERGNSTQVDVHGGESLSFNSSDGSGYNLAETIDPDSWDSWNADRDQLLNAQVAQKTPATDNFVNSQTVGMHDLDVNGNWYDVPGQGYVWSPYDAQLQGAGWDPYGYGHWAYYPQFGYQFVSGYNWGYAPYSCGMWNFYDNLGWGWNPGAGCNPWWGAGFYGGGGGGYYGDGGYYNIGNPYRGYQPPRRPTGPFRPHPGKPLQPPNQTSIAIDRRQPASTRLSGNTKLGQPVNIAGHIVEPLKPNGPRGTYDRASGSTSHAPVATPVYGVQGSSGGVRSGAHPVYIPQPTQVGQAPGYRPAPSSNGGGQQRSQPIAPHPSSGSMGGGHYSPPSMPSAPSHSSAAPAAPAPHK